MSPDSSARAFATRLDVSLAIIDKRRPEANVVDEMNIIGDVNGKATILLDDMVDTAGTIAMAAEALLRAGAKSVLGCCTHAVLSGRAVQKINDSPMEELIVTDSIPLNPMAKNCKKIKVLSVAKLIGEAIRRTHREESVSSLFV